MAATLQAIKTKRLFGLLGLSATSFIGFTTLPTQPLLAATLTTVTSFTGSGSGNGAAPQSGLTPSGSGTFYGTTSSGGANNLGSIFEFNPNNGSITLRGSFTSGTSGTGTGIYSTLTTAVNGKFYGTATQGGANGFGTIFEFDPSGGGSITAKASFTGSGTGNGAGPVSALTPSGSGTFYGATTNGGTNNYGAVFEFDPTGGTITRRATFIGGSSGTGTFPTSPLIAAGGGIFYGAAQTGGLGNMGTIYEFNSNNGSITRRASFYASTGSSVSSFISAGNGKYYGTATAGGANNAGTIFEFDPSAGTVTALADFGGSLNGSIPTAGMTPIGNGKFYGVTQYGGASNAGIVYEFDSSNNTLTRLADFSAGSGGYPKGSLTQVSPTLFYGTARNGGSGGSTNFGTVYAFNTAVPGPLPLLGAGVACGWSRQLRRPLRSHRPGVRVLA